MPRIISFIISICLAVTAIAQMSEADSLKNELQKTSNDSLKIIFYCLITDIYANFRPDSALFFAQQGLALSSQSGSKKGESRCLTRIGNIYKTIGDFPKALETHLSSLKLSESINDQVGIAAAYNNMAEVYKEQEDFPNALEYYYKTENIFIEIISKFSKVKNINLTQADLKKLQTYNDYLATTYMNIGDAYERMNIPDSSLLFQTRAYNLAITDKSNDIIGAILCNLGAIQLRMGHSSESLDNFNRSIPYLKNIDDKEFLAITYHGISEIFQKKDFIDSAILYARKSLNIVQEGSFQKEVLNAVLLLSQLFEKKRMPDSAFFYQKTGTILKDSIYNQEKSRKVSALNYKEQIRQQDLAETRRKEAKERNDSLQYFAISIFIVTFFVALLLLRRKKTKPKFIEYSGIIGLLLFFEFITLFIHPFISNWTHHTPVIMLIILVGVAAILTPLHHILTHWIKHRLAVKYADDHPVQIPKAEKNMPSIVTDNLMTTKNNTTIDNEKETIIENNKKKKRKKNNSN